MAKGREAASSPPERGTFGVCIKTTSKTGAKEGSAKTKKEKKASKRETAETENGGLCPLVVQELMRQHCKGMWSDSDDDSLSNKGSNNNQKGSIRQNNYACGTPNSKGENPPKEAEGETGKASDADRHQDQKIGKLRKTTETRATRKKGKDTKQSSELHPNEAGKIPTPPLSVSVRAPLRQQQHLEAGTDEVGLKDVIGLRTRRQQPQSGDAARKYKTKGLGRWSCMRMRMQTASYPVGARATAVAAARDEAAETKQTAGEGAGLASGSLQLLKKMGDLPFAAAGPQKNLKETPYEHTDSSTHTDSSSSRGSREKERTAAQEARKEFDEAVKDIRNIVYPHLGRFQRRQFLTTALRAMGIAAGKTQKMPLPELRAWQKATVAAIRKRREEEKTLGVSSHIDYQGSIQQASRARSKLKAQKARRKHLRDTFKHAGKLAGKKGRK